MDLNSSSSSVLCVGLTCVDLVALATDFPTEDSDSRCLDQWMALGGNASHNAAVLALLGNRAACLSVVNKEDNFSNFIHRSFASFGVDTSLIKTDSGPNSAPISVATCILSASSATRTILSHNKGARELSGEDLDSVDFSSFDWIHFEGRSNAETVVDQVARIKRQSKKNGSNVVVSVELEKPRSQIDPLMKVGDVVVVSKQRAKWLGFHDPVAAARGLRNRADKDAVVVVPWGEFGAAATLPNIEEVVVVKAHSPSNSKAVDTLGAGDTFVGGLIHGLRRRLAEKTIPEPTAPKAPKPGCTTPFITSPDSTSTPRFTFEELKSSMEFASWLAGEKCGHYGFDRFGKWYRNLEESKKEDLQRG